MNIEIDDGLNFGLGVFETILLRNGRAVFLDEHLTRINNSIENLKIKNKLEKEEIFKFLDSYYQGKNIPDNEVLKIIITDKNKIFNTREYSYTQADYEKGFSLNISKIIRNETSIFTFNKTLNYGDNILEKRNSKICGYDEPIFLNSKGQITEGATTNIFFVKDKKIFTPKLSCGLLNGILRQYIISNYTVVETEIYLEDLKNFDEAFVTNSLLGIMPVKNIENFKFNFDLISKHIFQKYVESLFVL